MTQQEYEIFREAEIKKICESAAKSSIRVCVFPLFPQKG
jgi:hypothetical protein